MTNFETATRLKLRFRTPTYATLTTEDLWDLSLEALDGIAKELNKKIKDSDESFIGKKTTVSKTLQVSFDVVKTIIDIKLEEADKAKTRADVRAKNARIKELIAQRQDKELSEKSLEELQSLLEEENV